MQQKCTRPEVALAVNKAARSEENTTLYYWEEIINILRYLNETKIYKLKYTGTE